MIRFRTPRSVRGGIAVGSAVGIAFLAGCAGGTDSAASDTTPAPDAPASTESTTGGGTYRDGTYSGEGSYVTPEGNMETVQVTVALADDVVTSVEVAGDPQKHESQEYQAKFIGGISDVVVGVDIDELSVSHVAGSSLTSGGFNQAIEQIKSEAAA
ncbi:hypothetical protein [Microbacterium sp.]|uniref:FMN-binding protein n=1 Tax=Microbacterium sp. TaxID=51671 RepID=UPI003A847C6D